MALDGIWQIVDESEQNSKIFEVLVALKFVSDTKDPHDGALNKLRIDRRGPRNGSLIG